MESGSPRSASNATYISRTLTARPAEVEEPRGRRWWPVILPVVVVALAATLILPATRHEWTLSIFRQPTPYTALSFSKAWALPDTVVTGRPLAISFVIDNQEGRTLQYRYVVTETSSDTSAVLAHSTKKVAAGQSSTVRVAIRPTCFLSPCRIQVSLPGHPETIDFLATVGA